MRRDKKLFIKRLILTTPTIVVREVCERAAEKIIDQSTVLIRIIRP
jgi:hypothetical protein